jgi:pyruvate/2-oxoglutarate dehydrogenase complex dihydrolipoamide dehydrogenase (E3) component
VEDDDRRLLGHVRPPDWRNPVPKPKYDLVVIGGGTAGLVCAAGAAGLGARVAIVERHRLGGDCLNTGCVPSKSLLRSARAVAEARSGAAAGVHGGARVDFRSAMQHLRARRADLAPHDSAARLASLGVDVFFGSARFLSPETVAVYERNDSNDSNESNELKFRRAVIATGSRPATPDIAGLESVPFLTSENVFELTEQPRSLAILGGGPIGCELAQAFALLGTQVTLLEAGRRLLPKDDEDAAAIVRSALERAGVTVRLETVASSIARDGERVAVAFDGGSCTADALLIATGRTPVVDGLRLDTAGVETNRTGVVVDERLRTSNSRIYASGDVCSKFKFTHAADALSRLVIQNALFFGRRRQRDLVIPWCTFTAPEVAQVGIAGEEAAHAGLAAITIPLTNVDRAVIDDETEGFLRVHHWKGRVRGATIVAPHAGELIGAVAMLMQRGGSLSDLASAVFPYPTLSVALRQAGDAYRRTLLTPTARRLLSEYLRLARGTVK